jgi:hypothetical protein
MSQVLEKLVLEIDERVRFGFVSLLELLAMDKIGWIE